MKIGVVIFHSNIQAIYKARWIQECVHSLVHQSISDFTFYEINYDGSDFSVLIDPDIRQRKKFWSIKMENYAEAMNFIISEAFNDGCDFVFNTNLDDKYDLDRIKKQLVFLKSGYDIVTSDFCYIEEDNLEEKDHITRLMLVSKFFSNILQELRQNHNIIAHPSVSYSRNFWLSGNRYDTKKTPEEDLDLWKKALDRGFKFFIIPEILLFYRIHKKQSSNKNTR